MSAQRFTPLTRDQFNAIPEAMKATRAATWQRIVTELGRAHYARYHANTDVRLIEWAQTRSAA